MHDLTSSKTDLQTNGMCLPLNSFSDGFDFQELANDCTRQYTVMFLKRIPWITDFNTKVL